MSAGKVESIASSTATAFSQAASSIASAVSKAIATVQGGGDAKAAAEALAQAIATVPSPHKHQCLVQIRCLRGGMPRCGWPCLVICPMTRPMLDGDFLSQTSALTTPFYLAGNCNSLRPGIKQSQRPRQERDHTPGLQQTTDLLVSSADLQSRPCLQGVVRVLQMPG